MIAEGTPLHEDVNYGVELDFGDHKETSWWWGQPHGFWDWYEKIGQDYHPRLITKAPIIKHIDTFVGSPEVISRGTK